MAGIQNNIEFAGGFKLQASSSRDISDMQILSTDVSNVNHVGSPEGVVSANPSSLCHDPVTGIIYVKQSGTGNTGWAAMGFGTVTSVSGTANRITSTGGATPVIDIAVTYVGQTSITTLGTIATGTWSATNIALNKGGTNASLTASNGGIFYSTSTEGAILAGTATAGKMLRSGSSAAPTWSTATWPATTTINQILYSSAANTVAGITAAANSVLLSNGSSVPSMGTSLANDFTFTSSTAGGNRVVTTTNTDNTNVNSNAYFTSSVGGTSAGDPFSRYVIGTARSFAWGIDNSDSQSFKMVTNNNATAAPSTGSIVYRMDTSGNLALPLNACCTADLNTGLTNATGDGTIINPIIFDTDSGNFFDQNGNYDTTTGIFTANATGKYLVTARVTYTGLAAGHNSGIVRINLNGGTYAINEFNPGASMNSANEFTGSISCIVPVSATGTLAILGQVSGSTKTVGVKGNSFGSFTSVSIVLIS